MSSSNSLKASSNLCSIIKQEAFPETTVGIAFAINPIFFSMQA
jgi:hypothetical protein